LLLPLKAWQNHPIPEVALWAREFLRNLKKEIASERKVEQEEDR